MRFRILEFNFAGSPSSPLFLTTVLCANGRVGQAHAFFRLGHFPLGWPWLKDECLSRIAIHSRKRKLHTKHNIEKRRVGMARADSDSSRRARPGERKLPLPKKCGQIPNGSFSRYLSRSAFCLPAHRHLGTRSPSGNARGGCRGVMSKNFA